MQRCRTLSGLAVQIAALFSAKFKMTAAPARQYLPRLAPLRISAAYSPIVKIALFAAHGFPLLACLSAGVPNAVRFVVVLTIVVSAIVSWRRTHNLSLLRFLMTADGALCVEREGRDVQVEILPGIVDMGWLLILPWRDEIGCTQRTVLAQDGFSLEDWHQLRIWQRWCVARTGEAAERV